MKKIYTSATKLVLLAMTLAVIAGTFTGHVEPEVIKTLTLMVFSFYFGQKVNKAL